MYVQDSTKTSTISITVHDTIACVVSYLSPLVVLRCVELQTNQTSSHHVQPVNVDYVISSIILVTKYTIRRKQKVAYQLYYEGNKKLSGISETHRLNRSLITCFFFTQTSAHLWRDTSIDPHILLGTPRKKKILNRTCCHKYHQGCTNSPAVVGDMRVIRHRMAADLLTSLRKSDLC